MGNVLVSVSDMRIGVDNTSDGVYDYYTANVVSASDYYPFGMEMDGRKQYSEKARYGFNGMEKDDEVSGSGNSYTAEFWQYDSRLGRRWNTDPVVKHHESPYATFSGNPIYFIDPNGDNASPIFDSESGDLLGTDNEGTQGDAIVMDADDFTQNMSHADALSSGTTLDNLPLVYSNEYRDNIQGQVDALATRVDSDGFLDNDEAISHWNYGGGDALFVDIGQIPFASSSLVTGDFDAGGGVGSELVVNFFDVWNNREGTMHRPADNEDLGRLYGTLVLRLVNAQGVVEIVDRNNVVGLIDQYDFSNPVLGFIRSRPFGNTTTFDIFGYGQGQINVGPAPAPGP